MNSAAHIVYVFHLLVILAGGLVATRAVQKDRALVGLITAMFGVAGMYLLMNAPYLALMQLMIYAGAVGVLIFFAVMFTRPAQGQEERGRYLKRPLMAVAAGLLPAATLAAGAFLFIRQAKAQAPEIPVVQLGAGLLGRYALAFELISVVLFAAMAGGVLLGFERRRRR
ncbi:MAG: NADH-quinone oxidoreductase subunit J [Desulfovibrio sp.]|jgi:NADH-quinone oxidoreductase subunit J|nr:NADH-quinone oxidoreductase subunit J [Desulfovibrio sp.]